MSWYELGMDQDAAEEMRDDVADATDGQVVLQGQVADDYAAAPSMVRAVMKEELGMTDEEIDKTVESSAKTTKRRRRRRKSRGQRRAEQRARDAEARTNRLEQRLKDAGRAFRNIKNLAIATSEGDAAKLLLAAKDIGEDVFDIDLNPFD